MNKKNEKIYNVSFSDYPWDILKITAASMAAAKKLANLYIRQWQLDAYIVNIEEEM